MKPLAYIAAFAKRINPCYAVSLQYGANGGDTPQWHYMVQIPTEGRTITQPMPDAQETTLTHHAFVIGETLKRLYPAAFGRTRDEEILTIDDYEPQTN